MFACAPATDRVIGAAEGVVAIVLAAGALGEVVEAEAAFQTVGGGEGRQARSLSDVLCLGAGDGDDDGRGRFPFATFVGGEPAGFLRQNETRVEGCEFFSNSEEGMGGGDAMDNQLSRWRVQVDGGGTRDQVEEGGSPRVEGGSLDRFHGDESDVVEGVALNALNESGAESSVDLIAKGDGGSRKGGPISLDEEPSFSEGRGLLLLGGGGFVGWGGCWGSGSRCA
jgi:hypothetical protein